MSFKQVYILIFGLACTIQAYGQNACNRALSEALRLYQGGLNSQSVTLLEGCLSSIKNK
jgi:hypothetical protein